MRFFVQIVSAIAFCAVLGWFGSNWYAQRHSVATPVANAGPSGSAGLVTATTPAAAPTSPTISETTGVVSDRSLASVPVVSPPGSSDAATMAPAHANAAGEPAAASSATPPLAAPVDVDQAIGVALSALMAPPVWERHFQTTELVRKFVLSVDNLTAGKLQPKYRLLKPVPGHLGILETDTLIMLDSGNATRYDALVSLIVNLNVGEVARIYRQFYPEIQRTYEALGFPGKAFDARLLEVIDHLLATTAPPAPIPLLQPKVFYQYADPELEAASAGQRMLYRLGPAHMARVQQWLTALRARLVTSVVPAGTR